MQQFKKIITNTFLSAIFIFTNIACQNQADDAMGSYWEMDSIIFQEYIGAGPISAAEAIYKSIKLDKSILRDRNRKAYQYGMALSYMRLYCLEKYTNFENTVNSKDNFLKYYQLWLEDDYNEKLAAEYVKEFECAVYVIDTESDVRWWKTLDESTSSHLRDQCLQLLDKEYR